MKIVRQFLANALVGEGAGGGDDEGRAVSPDTDPSAAASGRAL